MTAVAVASTLLAPSTGTARQSAFRGGALTAPSRSVLARSSASGEAEADEDTPPPGCSRYEIRVKKPLGLVLEEDKAGNIFVAEIVGSSFPSIPRSAVVPPARTSDRVGRRRRPSDALPFAHAPVLPSPPSPSVSQRTATPPRPGS